MATQGMYANQGVCQAKHSLAEPTWITLFVISQRPQALVWQVLLQEYKDINPFNPLIILGKLGQGHNVFSSQTLFALLDVCVSYENLTKLTNVPNVYACLQGELNFETHVAFSFIKYMVEEIRFF